MQTCDISSVLSSPLSKMMSLLESLSDGLQAKKISFESSLRKKKKTCSDLKKKKNSQKRGAKHILLIIIILLVTRVVSATFGAGGFLDGGGPLHRARQGQRRRHVLYVVRETELVEARRGLFVALRMLVRGALSPGAVGVAHHTCCGRLMTLDPGIVVADNVLMVEARQQRHLTFDAPELFTGRIDLDALHSIIAAI